MKKIRVDFYCSTFLTGGIETTLLQVLKNIDKDLFNVRLVILYKTLDQEVLLVEIPQSIEVVYVVPSRILNYFRSKRVTKKLKFPFNLIEEILMVNLRRILFFINIMKLMKSVDVVVDYGMCLTKYRNLLKNKKSVVYCHFSPSHLDRDNSERNSKRINELTQYTRIISICDEMKTQLIECLPNMTNQVDRVYNYMDANYVVGMSKETIPQDYFPYILAIGRLDESQKDYTTLIKGFAIAKREFKLKHKLLILGKGRDELALKQLSDELQLNEDVIFLGFDINPYRWLSCCELFVHSSKFEGLPTVVIEAMLLNRPVVVSNCPTGVNELLAGGKAGRLFEVGNEIELAEAINDVLSNESLRREYVAGSQEVIANFSLEQTIKKLETILLDI